MKLGPGLAARTPLAVLSGAAAALLLLLPESVATTLATVLLLGLAARSAGGLLAGRRGLADGFRAPALAAGLGLLATTMLIVGVVRIPSQPVVVAVLAVLAACGRPLAAPKRPSVATLLPAALLAIALVATLSPDLSWDTLAYHAAVPKLHLAAGRIVPTPTIFPSNLPNLADVAVLLAMRLGGVRAAAVPNFLFLVAIAGATFRLARVRLRPRASTLLAGAVLALPPLATQYGTALSEAASTAFAASAAAVAIAAGRRASGSRRISILTGTLAGFAAATKITGPVIAVAIGVVVIALAAARKRFVRSKPALFGAAAVLAALPTYLRIFITTGSPFFPFRVGPFAPRFFDAAALARMEKFDRAIWGEPPDGFVELLGAPMRSAFSGDATMACVLLALLLGSVASLRRRFRNPLPPVLAVLPLAQLSVWLFVSQQSRFLLPAAPSAIVLCAISIAELSRLRLLPLVPVPLLLLAGAPTLAARLRTSLGLEGAASPELVGAERLRSVLRTVNERTKPGDRLLLFRENRGLWLDRDYLWGDPTNQVIVDYRNMTNGEDLASRLSDLGITHALVGPYGFGDAGFDPHSVEVAFDLLAERRLLFKDGAYALYDLREPADRPAPPLAVASSSLPLFSADAVLDSTARPWKCRIPPTHEQPQWLLLLAPPTAPIGTIALLGDPGGAFRIVADGRPVPVLATLRPGGIELRLPAPARRIRILFVGPGLPVIEEVAAGG